MSAPGRPLLRRRSRSGGFTVLELMITAAIIGIISAVAIPLFVRYQAKSKSAEVKSNLSSLRVAEETYFTEHDFHYAANPEPALIPGTRQVDFDAAGSDFADLGWAPEGRVYFSYAVAVSPDGIGYTADAGADIDGDGIPQLWGYAKPDGAGVLLDGAVGCDASFLAAGAMDRCGADASLF